MENKLFYESLCEGIASIRRSGCAERMKDYLKRTFEKYGLVSEDKFYPHVDYKKIFLRIYFDMAERSSLNFGGKGTEIDEENIRFTWVTEMRYIQRTHGIYLKEYRNISYPEYRKLLIEHELL